MIAMVSAKSVVDHNSILPADKSGYFFIEGNIIVSAFISTNLDGGKKNWNIEIKR